MVNRMTGPSAPGGSVDLSNLNASNLTSGTVPDARFPATLPAKSGVNLTALNADNLGSGTVPDARFPATLPAVSGANLTNLPAPAQLKSGSGTLDGSGQLTVSGATIPGVAVVVACYGEIGGTNALSTRSIGFGDWMIESHAGALDAGFAVNWIAF